MGRVDVHHHIVPDAYRRLLRSRQIMPGGLHVPKWSARRSLSLMDSLDVDAAILSVSTPGAWLGDLSETRQLARELNEACAATVREHPTRFGFFATLPVPDIDGAVVEIGYAMDTLGAEGVVLFSNTDGVYLGDARLDPVMTELDARAAVVFIHPSQPPGGPAPGVAGFVVDFPFDTTRAALSLTLSGALERFPRITFILAHGGGFLPFVRQRARFARALAGDTAAQLESLAPFGGTPIGSADPLRRFHLDIALSTGSDVWDGILSLAGSSRTLFGTDYPYASPLAVRAASSEYDQHPLTAGQRADIDSGNARRLLPRLR